MMHNVLTVDVEDWYMTSDLNIPVNQWDGYEDRVDANTRRLLDLFDEYEVKGTFFVLGCVALKFPDVIQEIARRGHEIGSHGMWHQMLTRLSRAEIETDIAQSKIILEDLTGQTVQCYRAPSWSISPERYYVWDILEKLGFTVDSSLQPFRTPLSGIRRAPAHPFHPIVDGRRHAILEYPPAVARIWGQTVPFSGGLYLRVWPERIVRFLLARVNHTSPGSIYVHPWELDERQPQIAQSPLIRFTHYHNLRSTENKLRALLEEFDFVCLKDVIATNSYPAIDLTG